MSTPHSLPQPLRWACEKESEVRSENDSEEEEEETYLGCRT